jgi:hypothetical protein
MKLKVPCLLALAACAGFPRASAQTLQVTSTGVGIGTAAPVTALQINGSVIAGGAGSFLVPYTGFPSQQNNVIEIKGNPAAAVGVPGLQFSAGGRTTNRDWAGTIAWASSDYSTGDLRGAALYVEYTGSNYTDGNMIFSTRSGTDSGIQERMRISAAGNVGVGTTSPNYTLDVAGQVHAASFIAASGNTYADFVFKPGYKLPALSDVEASIAKAGHLPGIPSESDAKAHGVDLGAMQTKLLQKVEELTLYLVAQDRELKQLQDENEALRKRVSVLEEQ